MKRCAQPSATSERQSFQQPVSCHLCRSRKLKCDRGNPCFNCSSRSFDCVYSSALQPTLKTSETGLEHRKHQKEHTSIIQRLQRLESAVFPAEDPEVPSCEISSRNSHSENAFSNQDEEPQRTSKWFEALLAEPHTGDGSRTTKISFHRGGTVAPGSLGSSFVLREFPTYNDASMLLNLFTKTIDATYHLLHIPTVWQWHEELYADLNANRIPSATQLAFFLATFAGAAYVSKSDLQFEKPGLAGKSQMTLSESWLKQSVFLLTKPPVPPSIQALQTAAHLSHLCSQIEGFTGSFGSISMFCVHMVKAMKIHRLDTARCREERNRNGADMVDIEAKRRIWWHLVASDWLLSFVGGPNEGTYMLHPRQMETVHPSNVDDQDIPTGTTYVTEDKYSLPLDRPTSISYFLYRIQAATLSREVTYNLPISFFDSPGAESCDEVYQKIIHLDKKYQHLLKSLPPFFQLTVKGDLKDYEALIKERPYLEWQRYLINFVIHTHLARLHRPFLIRGTTQHKFAYSRMQCIRSAETVLAIHDLAICDQGIGGFTFVLSHFMMAAVILAMDVCFNPDEIGIPQREQEVLRACRVLEETLTAKMQSHHNSEPEDCSSGELMLKSFQKAIQNLRGILRKQGTKDNPQRSSRFSGDIPRNDKFTKNASLLAREQEQATLQAHGNSSKPSNEGSEGQSGMDPQLTQFEAVVGQQEIVTSTTPYEFEIPQGSSDLIIDELWSEFFSVGPTFQ